MTWKQHMVECCASEHSLPFFAYRVRIFSSTAFSLQIAVKAASEWEMGSGYRSFKYCVGLFSPSPALYVVPFVIYSKYQCITEVLAKRWWCAMKDSTPENKHSYYVATTRHVKVHVVMRMTNKTLKHTGRFQLAVGCGRQCHL